MLSKLATASICMTSFAIFCRAAVRPEDAAVLCEREAETYRTSRRPESRAGGMHPQGLCSRGTAQLRPVSLPALLETHEPRERHQLPVTLLKCRSSELISRRAM